MVRVSQDIPSIWLGILAHACLPQLSDLSQHHPRSRR
jgi:hypothetical protein